VTDIAARRHIVKAEHLAALVVRAIHDVGLYRCQKLSN